MGGCVSAPKTKGAPPKAPSKHLSENAASSQHRRPSLAHGTQPLAVSTAQGGIPPPVVPPPTSGLDGIAKEQASSGKVPSNKVRPSHGAGNEEASERRKDRGASDIVARPIPKSLEGEQIAAGWPAWLASVASEAIKGWVPRRADSFEKLDKIGQGTYSNVYKARDLESGKLVALKKVRFDNLEPESVRFMAREIEVLRRLNHPNVVKLEGLVTSRMSCSLYLVFEYMEHDLAGLAACPGVTFTESQVKCYMQQLLSGLEHCHKHGVLHRDIKGSNLLLDNTGTLKIADFGLATFYRPEQNVPLTSRVVTLWYRPPELLLGATHYGVAVDLWSAGCILAELLAGKPIMPGRTEVRRFVVVSGAENESTKMVEDSQVEQLHKIFKLCGSPSEEYWRKSKLPHATIFKPSQPYKRNLREVFKDFPATSLALLDILLAIEPADRGTATQALQHEFFTTEPLPCDPSSLPEYPPSKEYDAKLRDEEARRNKGGGARGSRAAMVDRDKRTSASMVQQVPQPKQGKAVPAPLANAELMESIAVQKQNMTKQNTSVAKSSSERFLGADGGHGTSNTITGAGVTGATTSQFKAIDTPDGPTAGRPNDRNLHRTGTASWVGSSTGGHGSAAARGPQGQGAPGGGGTSAGKYASAIGDGIGDRSLSMARPGQNGSGNKKKDVAQSGTALGKDTSGLQAGDVSFTLQRKMAGNQ